MLLHIDTLQMSMNVLWAQVLAIKFAQIQTEAMCVTAILVINSFLATKHAAKKLVSTCDLIEFQYLRECPFYI